MAIKTATKVKKKKWFEIIAPQIFNEQVVGETLGTEKETLMGKTVKINLMELSRDIKKQHIYVKLRVVDVKENKALTEIISCEITPSALKRQVRRKRDKLCDSFACRTADKKLVRIKPVVITAHNAKGSIMTLLRRATRRLVSGVIRQISYNDLMSDIVSTKLQNYIADNLSKIYPIRYCDIMYCGITARSEKYIIGETDRAERHEAFIKHKPKKKKLAPGEEMHPDELGEQEEEQEKPKKAKSEEATAETD